MHSINPFRSCKSGTSSEELRYFHGTQDFILAPFVSENSRADCRVSALLSVSQASDAYLTDGGEAVVTEIPPWTPSTPHTLDSMFAMPMTLTWCSRPLAKVYTNRLARSMADPTISRISSSNHASFGRARKRLAHPEWRCFCLGGIRASPRFEEMDR